jgi:signal transduction histidine kinase
VTRAVLVADLDDLLTQRAVSLAKATARGEPEESPTTRPPATAQDRFVVKASNRVVRASGDSAVERPVPPPRKAAFVRLADGRLVRTVTVQVPVHGAPGTASGPAEVLTVVYSSPADQLGRVLSRLALTLTVCGVAAGAAAAAVAAWAARAALRPLHDASAIIGEIDERKLDRRIGADGLPPELQPAAARLNEMLERLERAFAQRKQFLADASHELRTPVAALVTTIEVALRRRRSADELERTLESCLTDARHLKRLVHVLMEHARGEASAAAQSERPEPLDAAELLAECADIAATLGTVKDVHVERAFASPLPVVTQPQRLRSVVMNLLSNAVEYNKPGGVVHLAARLKAGQLEVIVRDTGRGIAAEHVPHLFEPFYRGDGSRRLGGAPTEGAGAVDEASHLGLGLFLVDSHLKALNGRCTVQSEPGVGTTITVTLPVGEVPAGAATRVAGSGSAVTKSDVTHGGSVGSVGAIGSPNVSAVSSLTKRIKA